MVEKTFFQVLNERRSIRNFKSTTIDEWMVNKIKDACDCCPSAGGLQSFEVYDVKDKKIRNQIVEASMDQEFLAEAPVLLIFCANTTRSRKYGKKAKLFSVQDATVAASYAQLTATALGLSSVWVGAFNEKTISSILGLLEGIVPVALLPIGYKNEDPQLKTTRGPSDLFHAIE